MTLPPQTVLLHGLPCDGGGHKTSKSWGKVIDPLDVISGGVPGGVWLAGAGVCSVLMFIGCGEQYLDSSWYMDICESFLVSVFFWRSAKERFLDVMAKIVFILRNLYI